MSNPDTSIDLFAGPIDGDRTFYQMVVTQHQTQFEEFKHRVRDDTYDYYRSFLDYFEVSTDELPYNATFEFSKTVSEIEIDLDHQVYATEQEPKETASLSFPRHSHPYIGHIKREGRVLETPTRRYLLNFILDLDIVMANSFGNTLLVAASESDGKANPRLAEISVPDTDWDTGIDVPIFKLKDIQYFDSEPEILEGEKVFDFCDYECHISLDRENEDITLVLNVVFHDELGQLASMYDDISSDWELLNLDSYSVRISMSPREARGLGEFAKSYATSLALELESKEERYLERRSDYDRSLMEEASEILME